MASDQSTLNVNGNYSTIHTNGYSVPDQNYSSNGTTPAIQPSTEFVGNTTGNDASVAGSGGGSDIPPAEVGWYFVEQYYTTLSKSPDKLFLYYTKKSQFVSGEETAKVAVCVGQKAINERIKELDFQECKVRVTNVDSQGSGSNIVIQVIGEMSVRKQPSRKFCQTFVLAEQKSGYFVLNDIFRLIIEEDDGEPEGATGEDQLHANDTSGGNQEPELAAVDGPLDVLAPSSDQPETTRVPDTLDAEPETMVKAESPLAKPADASAVDIEHPSAIAPVEDVPVALANDETETSANDAPHLEVQPMTDEFKPSESEPEKAEASTVPLTAPAPTATAAKTEAPKTWAKMVAGNKVPPAVPATTPAPSNTTAPSAPPPARSPVAPATPSAPPASATDTPPDSEQAGTPQSSGSEWQTAGPDHSRKQSRTQSSQVPPNNARGYIKNVVAEIDFEDLKQTMAQFGTLQYFDINRTKNAAFVDWETPASYQAAVAANPHNVNGRRIVVEERIVRPGSVPYNRGRNSRGRGFDRGVGPSRGGFSRENGGRGGYSPRGRGSMTPRGDGGVSQTS